MCAREDADRDGGRQRKPKQQDVRLLPAKILPPTARTRGTAVQGSAACARGTATCSAARRVQDTAACSTAARARGTASGGAAAQAQGTAAQVPPPELKVLPLEFEALTLEAALPL